MGTIWKRGHKNQGPKAKARRVGALIRLETQLKKGLKTERDATDLGDGYKMVMPGEVPLTENDTKRIRKEIEILKQRA